MSFSPDPLRPVEAGLDMAKQWLAAMKFSLHYPAVEGIIARVNVDAWKAKIEEYSTNGAARGAYKYLDLTYWVARSVRNCVPHGLERQGGRNVLDLGSGGCHFVALVEAFGHKTENVDDENPCPDPVGNKIPIFDDIAALLGFVKTVHRIEPLKPMRDFGHKFDLVTAHLANFHQIPPLAGAPGRHYSHAEWAYLLNDLAENQLRYPATIHLELNADKRLDDGSFIHDPVMMDWFKANGAVFGRGGFRPAVSFDLREPRRFA